jgi:protein transport protein SEC23
VRGALGPVCSLKVKDISVSDDLPIGESGTSSWYIGALERNTTICFVLDVPAKEITENKGKSAIVQFRTTYKNYNGEIKLRVTTFQKSFGSCHREEFKKGFDQEAAITTVARIAVNMAEADEHKEIMKWLDRKLIQLYARFGDYTKNNINTFSIGDEFNLYPQFIYYLRKSNFVSKFATSVDECAYWRSGLMKESIGNVLVMIQPTLYEYDPEVAEPNAVPCDTTSMRSDIILLVDTFYNVIIWHGNTIAEWIKAGYDEDPNFEHFAHTLKMPHEDMQVFVFWAKNIVHYGRKVPGSQEDGMQ